MDFKIIVDWIGEKVSFLSTKGLEEISKLIGQEPTAFMGKLITLIILGILIWIGSIISQKVVKVAIIILSVVLGISVIYSIFV